MDGQGVYQYYEGDQGAQYFVPPAQSSTFSQTPLQHPATPHFLPMNFSHLPTHPPMHMQPAAPQVGGVSYEAMNGSLPQGGLPPFPAQAAQAPFGPVNQAMPGTFDQGQMAMAPAEVVFDPSTPPPFADRAQMQTPRSHGVLKISNIPYTISIPELHQFICKYVPIPHLITAHVHGYPTHIIMERSTGKTMDAYIELKSPELAAADWEHAFGLTRMRVPKMGQRNVEVSISSQGELMKDIFPRAKCIHWDNDDNGAPKLVPNRDVYSSGFNGFLTQEETSCMERHVENPQRSQFATRSMNRPFECMISTCYKFPWYAGNLYSMRQTQVLFNAFMRQLEALINKLTTPNVPREVGLDNKLLMDHIFAGLTCPGFSERNKARIVDTCVVVGTGFPLSKHAATWPFQTLTTFPAGLSDQDVGMWLELVYIGMGIMEQQGRTSIGISSYLEVVRDDNGHPVFTPTEEGLDLKRAQFAILEQRMMRDLLDHGWNSYLPQMGIDPSALFDFPTTQGMDNDFMVGAAQVDPIDPFVTAGPSHTRGQTGTYKVNDNGDRQAASDHASSADIEDDWDFIQAGDPGVTDDSFNDPEEALAAMREVVDQIRDAPPIYQEAAASGVAGLGAGLNNVALDGNGNRTGVARYVPPARRASGPVRAQAAPMLNPESPAFTPPAPRNTQVVDAPFLPPPTAFGGRGLGIGNGDFTTSPPRVDTRRGPAAIFSIADQIRRNESALTAPAAGIRLQPAPAMAPLGPAIPNQGAQYGRALTYGRGNNSQVLQGLAASAAQRRVVTIRDPSNSNSVASLQPSVASTSDSVIDGPGPAIQVAPIASSSLNITRLRLSTVASPHKHGTDGNASIDDQLDEIFGLYTDEPTRLAMSAGMNMRTESAGTLAPPSTPPAQSAVPAPALRRSPAREYLNTAYEFDEGLDMSQAEGTPTAPPIITKFGPSASAPATPSRNVQTPNRSIFASGGSVYGTGNTSGGVNLFSQYRPLESQPARNIGAVGDGSPRRRAPAQHPRVETARRTLTQRYTLSEGTPEARARRLAGFQARMDRYEAIGEDDL